MLYAQDKLIRGVIVDARNSPLVGVSVGVPGTTIGTISDQEGNYSLNVSEGTELTFSSIGMKPKVITIGAATVYNVTLDDDATMIDETVVIGYGSAKRLDLTGSIVRVEAKDIANRPSSNPAALLQGKVSGVQVLNTGVPGQDPEIRMRGTNSINGYRPLYVVDGFLVDNINHINPADIESMDVLKDPSSLAIFGNRGANGVIIVTSKQAKLGQTRVNINSSVGLRHIPGRIKVTDASDFKELFNEQNINQGDTPFDFSPWDADTDWQDEVVQTGFITNNNVSISGTSERNSFYMGVGYAEEEGSIKHEKFSRLTFNLSGTYKPFEFMRFGYQVNASRTLPADVKGSAISGAVRAAPVAPITTMYVDPITGEEEELYYMMPEFQAAQVSNPMHGVEVLKKHNIATNYRVGANIFGEVDFLKYFNFKATFLVDYLNNNSRSFSPMTYAHDPTLLLDERKVQLSFSEGVSQSKSVTLNTQADYILTFQNKFGDHNITATAGLTTAYTDAESIGVGRSQKMEDIVFGIPNDNRDKWWISSIGDKTMTNSGGQHRRFTMSYLFRVLYNYKDRYLLNASYRRDGSSVFRNAGKTWDNFYAFGVGWVATQEEFMKNQNVIDFLKVKGSYGVLGSQNTGSGGSYPTYPGLVQITSAVFDGREIPTYGLRYRFPPDRQLGWEKTHALEVGIETGWLGNRLSFEGVYYHKNTKDIIVMAPPFSGAQNALGNAGDILNKGFEFTLSWDDITPGGFSYGVSANLTTVKNKVKKLAYGPNWEIHSNVARTTPGYSIAHFYGYEVEGVYQNIEDIYQSPTNTLAKAQPGDLKFRDLNGDGKITPEDRTEIGKPTPDCYYGLTANLAYKGIDLGIDMMGVYGNEIYRTWDRHTYAQLNFLTDRKGRWHGEGTSNWEPILHRGRSLNVEPSNYYIEDGSYFRIRNIQLGYTFNQNVLRKLRMQTLRVYINIENPKTWKKNTGYTPEIGGSALASGFDGGTYPLPAIYTFGINITF